MRLVHLTVALALAAPVTVQDSADDLAKKSQNPLANMIALPLQNNTNFGAGPEGETTTNDLNIQPVIPAGLRKLLLINRLVLPIITANWEADFSSKCCFQNERSA